MRMPYPVEELEVWQLGYIAGIVDGEGCLNLSKQTNRKDISPVVVVGMTDVKCVQFLYNITGVGNFFVKHGKQTPKNYKTKYVWAVRGRLEIYLLLKAIYPYLVVKKEQTDVMLEFVERRIQGRLFTGRDIELMEEMHKLNK